jgi:dTDP-4-dehydrorhamnose 3,5-epimerase
MRFEATELVGVRLIHLDRIEDERGWFARSYSAEEFKAHGIDFTPVQSSFAHNKAIHTLRGLHWQAPPSAEGKIVQTIQGAVYDVALDLRPRSPSYGRWKGFTLNADSLDALYLPPGIAHGYLTLTERTILSYQIDAAYAPEQAKGVRWDDPAFAIRWPAYPAVISPRDAAFPDFVR